MGGRLALHTEGEFWVAYYEPPTGPSTMIGSIRAGAVHNNKERRQAFTDLMRDIVDNTNDQHQL